MADHKYANAKCFVLTENGYKEITYHELLQREQTDKSYLEKKFIPLHGMLLEVSEEEYIS